MGDVNDNARFGVGLSQKPGAVAAAQEACAAVLEALGPGPSPTLVVLFASPDLCRDAEGLLDAVHTALAPEHLIGAMGEAIVGAGREIEEGPALVVWAARLPGARIVPFRLVARPLADGVGVLGWPDALGEERAFLDHGPVLMLADPFSFPADGLLAELGGGRSAPLVVGGLASGGRAPGEHRLFAGRDVVTEGAVALALGGASAHVVVSQGCLPVGPEMVITSAEGSHIHELAGVPALAKLREVVDGLEPAERALALDGLLAGLVIDENTPDYRRGDFLVRAIHGADHDAGTLVVGEHVRVGQTLRFQVRDSRSADDDLRAALRATRAEIDTGAAGGALLFSCNGRGTHMFSEPDHDAHAVMQELGDIPAAGFFCNGEIGPVAGRSFLHAFTATLIVFSMTP